MKIKTSEATEIQLDYLVAKALGYTDYPDDSLEHGTIWHTDPELTPFGRFIEKRRFHPSTNWSQGGPIIEREKITISALYDQANPPSPEYALGEWGAYIPCGVQSIGISSGPTPLIAAMRCLVASKLGDEVEIPEELK